MLETTSSNLNKGERQVFYFHAIVTPQTTHPPTHTHCSLPSSLSYHRPTCYHYHISSTKGGLEGRRGGGGRELPLSKGIYRKINTDVLYYSAEKYLLDLLLIACALISCGTAIW